jgi:hypothetical protein
MTNPLRLLPTSALADTVSSEKPIATARERIVEFVTKRDGAFSGGLKLLFKGLNATSPASAYGVTFSELVNDIGLGLDNLLDEKLIGSWMDCVSLKITLDDVIPPYEVKSRHDRCNIHLLKKRFGDEFDKHLGKDPLRVRTKGFASTMAPRMRPSEFVALSLNAKDMGDWLLKRTDKFTPLERTNLRKMLDAGSRDDWVGIGLPYDPLDKLTQTD